MLSNPNLLVLRMFNCLDTSSFIPFVRNNGILFLVSCSLSLFRELGEDVRPTYIIPRRPTSHSSHPTNQEESSQAGSLVIYRA